MSIKNFDYSVLQGRHVVIILIFIGRIINQALFKIVHILICSFHYDIFKYSGRIGCGVKL